MMFMPGIWFKPVNPPVFRFCFVRGQIFLVSIVSILLGLSLKPILHESFNGTFRNECLNAEVFGSLLEAQVVIEQWRKRYNTERPHSTQDYITPDMAYFGLRSH